MGDEVTELRERLARLEREARKPSAFRSVAQIVGKVLGWFIIIPFAIVTAFGALICSLGLLLVIFGKLGVGAYFIWLLITPICGGIVAIGAALAGIGHWASTEEG